MKQSAETHVEKLPSFLSRLITAGWSDHP